MTKSMTPEKLAKLFHTIYETLAPKYGYETNQDSAVRWENVPIKNKALMIATCAEVLNHLNKEQ